MAKLQCPRIDCGGCHVRSSFTKYTYVFSWSIEKYPKWPLLSKIQSPEFHPFADRSFFATLEIKYAERMKTIGELMIGGDFSTFPTRTIQCFLSIVLKSGDGIRIRHDFSITDCSGKVYRAISQGHKYSGPGQICVFSSAIGEEIRHLTKDKTLIFKCAMETEQFSEEVAHKYPMPSQSDNLPVLVDSLKTMYATSLHADINLKVEDIVMLVHKSILCARSPVFAKMFESPTAENETNVIDIPDVKLSVLKDLVEFLYTGHLRSDDFESVYALYYAADKYDVSSLRKTCVDVLRYEMDIQNACRVLSLANRHSNVQLKDSAMDFIQCYCDKILKTYDWANLCEYEPELAEEVKEFVVRSTRRSVV